MEKQCTKCKNVKPLEDFHRCKDRTDGRQSACKICRRKYSQSEQTKIYKKEWYQKNNEKVRRKAKIRREADLEAARLKRRQDYKKKTEQYKLASKKRHARLKTEDPEGMRAKQRQRGRRWKQENKHVVAWRNTLRHGLETLKQKKTDRTIAMLGYTAEELRTHLEQLWLPGMTWGNYGEWHIDHIQPLYTLPKDTPPHVANALCNLRPLWATTRTIDGIIYEGNLNRNCPNTKRKAQCSKIKLL